MNPLKILLVSRKSLPYICLIFFTCLMSVKSQTLNKSSEQSHFSKYGFHRVLNRKDVKAYCVRQEFISPAILESVSLLTSGDPTKISVKILSGEGDRSFPIFEEVLFDTTLTKKSKSDEIFTVPCNKINIIQPQIFVVIQFENTEGRLYVSDAKEENSCQSREGEIYGTALIKNKLNQWELIDHSLSVNIQFKKLERQLPIFKLDSNFSKLKVNDTKFPSIHRKTICLDDFNLDGKLDLLFGSQLFVNQGSNFRDVTVDCGLPKWENTDFFFIDINRDRYIDLMSFSFREDSTLIVSSFLNGYGRNFSKIDSINVPLKSGSSLRNLIFHQCNEEEELKAIINVNQIGLDKNVVVIDVTPKKLNRDEVLEDELNVKSAQTIGLKSVQSDLGSVLVALYQELNVERSRIFAKGLFIGKNKELKGINIESRGQYSQIFGLNNYDFRFSKDSIVCKPCGTVSLEKQLGDIPKKIHEMYLYADSPFCSSRSLVDFDMDGINDVIVSSSSNCIGVKMFKGYGEDEFENISLLSGINHIKSNYDLAIGDVNNDSYPDLVVEHAGKLEIYINNLDLEKSSIDNIELPINSTKKSFTYDRSNRERGMLIQDAPTKIEFDGTQKSEKTEQTESLLIWASPSIFNQKFELKILSNITSRAKVSFFDFLGKEISSLLITIQNGSNSYEIREQEFLNQPDGAYLVRVECLEVEAVRSCKVVKIKL